MAVNFIVVSIASAALELDSVNQLMSIMFGSQVIGVFLGHGANSLILERASKSRIEKIRLNYLVLPVSRIILVGVLANVVLLLLGERLSFEHALFNQAIAFVLINLLGDYMRVNGRRLLGACLVFCLIPSSYCVCLFVSSMLGHTNIESIVNAVSLACIIVFLYLSRFFLFKRELSYIGDFKLQKITSYSAILFLPYGVVAILFSQLEYWVAYNIFSEQLLFDLTIAWRMGAVFSIPYSALSFIAAKRLGESDYQTYAMCYKQEIYKLVQKYIPLYLLGGALFVVFGKAVLETMFPAVSDSCIVFVYAYLGYHMLSLLLGPVELFQLLNGGRFKITVVSFLLGVVFVLVGEVGLDSAYQVVTVFLLLKLVAKIYLACSKGVR